MHTAADRFENAKEPGKKVYRIENTCRGSSVFGVCEICNTDVAETFMQTEGFTCMDDRSLYVSIGASTFGHEICLLNSRVK